MWRPGELELDLSAEEARGNALDDTRAHAAGPRTRHDLLRKGVGVLKLVLEDGGDGPGGVHYQLLLEQARPVGPARRHRQLLAQRLQALLGDRGVHADAVGLHHIGQAGGVDQLVDRRTGVEEEHRSSVDMSLGVGSDRRLVAEVDHGDPSHRQTVEITNDGFHHCYFLADAVDHPVAWSIELDPEGSHLTGDDVSVEGVPQLLGAVVQHLSAVDLSLESRVPKEGRDDLAVADPAHVRDQSLRSGVGHGRRPFGRVKRHATVWHLTRQSWLPKRNAFVSAMQNDAESSGGETRTLNLAAGPGRRS